jgi:hypothetical protein
VLGPALQIKLWAVLISGSFMAVVPRTFVQQHHLSIVETELVDVEPNLVTVADSGPLVSDYVTTDHGAFAIPNLLKVFLVKPVQINAQRGTPLGRDGWGAFPAFMDRNDPVLVSNRASCHPSRQSKADLSCGRKAVVLHFNTESASQGERKLDLGVAKIEIGTQLLLRRFPLMLDSLPGRISGAPRLREGLLSLMQSSKQPEQGYGAKKGADNRPSYGIAGSLRGSLGSESSAPLGAQIGSVVVLGAIAGVCAQRLIWSVGRRWLNVVGLCAVAGLVTYMLSGS